MKQDTVHNFFHESSRIILVVPLIILLTGLIMRYDVFQKKNATIQSKLTAPTTGAINISLQPEGRFSFTGDFACSARIKTATMSAYRSRSGILIKSATPKATSSYLVNGDCLYTWEGGGRTGEKKCSIGQYVNILNSMSAMGILNADSLINLIPQDTDLSSYGLNMADIKTVIKSCRNRQVSEKGLFELPKNIQFIQTGK